MVKVEMERNEEKKIVSLVFTASDDESLDIIDAVRVAVMSELPKRFEYSTSRQLVIQIKEG